MKTVRGATIHRGHRQGALQRGVEKQSKFKLVYTGVIFCVLSLSFATLFSTVTEGAKVISPEKKTSIVSTKNKPGVSVPVGVATTAANGSKGAKNVVANGIPSVVGIPAKPAWVTKPLYVDPTNVATQYVQNNPTVAGAGYIARMGQNPVAQWFGDWNANVQSDVNAYVSAATAAGSVPQLALYNIPNRDCGGYSVGGANGVAVYTQWAQKVAAGIGNRTAVVVLEPDALGALDCLPAAAQKDRLQSIAQAVTILKSHPGTSVYIDAGTAFWQSAKTMASRLQAANVAQADGFSLNVSYFASIPQNKVFGDQLSSLIGNKHYVIDTSRNGANHVTTGAICNPSWAAFGQDPTTNTGSPRVDGYLWIKIPWESDGPCNGSPDPGEPYWSYAIQLAQNAGW